MKDTIRNVNLRITDEEEAIILPREVWQHIAETYQTMGSDCKNVDEMMSWYRIADNIREQLEHKLQYE